MIMTKKPPGKRGQVPNSSIPELRKENSGAGAVESVMDTGEVGTAELARSVQRGRREPQLLKSGGRCAALAAVSRSASSQAAKPRLKASALSAAKPSIDRGDRHERSDREWRRRARLHLRHRCVLDYGLFQRRSAASVFRRASSLGHAALVTEPGQSA